MINEDVRVNDPVDISYVYNGYSPLSVKFIEAVMMSHGYKGMEESKVESALIILIYRGEDAAWASHTTAQ